MKLQECLRIRKDIYATEKEKGTPLRKVYSDSYLFSIFLAELEKKKGLDFYFSFYAFDVSVYVWYNNFELS